MLPSLQPGDRLVVVPVPTPRPGMVVALPDPRDPSRTLVKRVAVVEGDAVRVAGDNPAASTDSRSFGAVPTSSLLGRAVYRYAPLARVGRLG
jgi:nickel-type superoxide dismutase maturation protease